MRRVLIILAIVAALILIVVIVGASLLNVDRYRPQIEAELQKSLGRPVSIGQLHLHLFRLSVRVDGLTIQESPAFPSPQPFATAKEVYASAGLLSLIHGKPDITGLTLQDPQIELIRNASGTWNFSELGSGSGGSDQSHQSQLTLENVKILNGQVAVTDQHANTPRSVYNHIDLTLSGFAPGKQFDIDLAAHFPGQGKELLTFSGKAGPLAPGNIPMEGHASLQEISIRDLNSVAKGAIPPNTDAVASGDAEITSQNGDIGCKGKLTLANAVVRGAKVNYPIESQYDLSLNQKDDKVQVKSATVKIGATAVSITGEVNSGVKPANLNMRVSTSNASITELLKLASIVGATSNPNAPVKGSISANLNVQGPVTAPTVQGDLSSNTLQAQDLVLSNVRATVNMDNGVARLSPVTAGVFGGQANGAITLDTKGALPTCSLNTKLSGVDTNALLSAVSSLKDTLYGNLAADANLSFRLDSGPNLARTLAGTLGFNVTNGHLKNVNILSELSKIGRFVGTAPAQTTSGTVLQRLSGTLNIQNGVATTNNLVAVLDEGSLSANGSLNLVNQGINMHVSAVLGGAVSKQVGGTGVGGFLNTVLANNTGELVVPVLVTGTMAHPLFAPDVEAIAKMKLNHLLPTSGDPSKLTSGIVGSVLGGVLGQGSSKQNKQPTNPIDSILNGLKKR